MPKIKKPNFRKVSSPSGYTPIFSLRTKILLFTGLFLMITPLVFYLNQTVQLMYVVPHFSDSQLSKSLQSKNALPIKIVISKVRLDLPIEETVIQNNSWTIAKDAASHLHISSSPGENGPVILYAHNTNDRFGPIRWLNRGDSIQILTSDRRIHNYRIVAMKQTSADQLSVFFEHRGETLYLFTCDGFADLKRYIVIAEPIASVSAIRE